jgi:nitronate monooxygenase
MRYVAMVTDLTKKFGIDTPIIQAPMAGVSTPALVAAVSNVGALGSLSVGAMTVKESRSAIQEIRAKTNRPFNVNVFCHKTPKANPERDVQWLKTLTPFFEGFDVQPPNELKEIYLSFNHNERMLELFLEEQPKVVSFHFGLPPSEFIRALKKAGIILIASATNLDEARQIEESGLDAVIAQGYEAGGHRGIFNEDAEDDKLGTLALTRLLVKKINLPVISAGGIMDGAGIAAVLTLGAQAAQLGTAFISCPESAADDGYKRALKSESALHTIMTRFISGRPARGLRNRLTALEDNSNLHQTASYPLAYDAAKTLHAVASAQGSEDFVTRWAGQSASLSRAMPAGELIEVLRQEIVISLRHPSDSA